MKTNTRKYYSRVWTYGVSNPNYSIFAFASKGERDQFVKAGHSNPTQPIYREVVLREELSRKDVERAFRVCPLIDSILLETISAEKLSEEVA